ncbi:MAG: phosphoribosylpyrophosphate synthetase [Sphingobacteriaceae bacterium]
MSTMTTVSQVLNKLKSQGYTVDFNLDATCLICHGNSLKVNPDEFVVDKHYRFEGLSDPGDEAIVYAISSEKHRIKGTLVNGYGISSDSMTHEMIKALTENPLTMANNYSNAGVEKKHDENITKGF